MAEIIDFSEYKKQVIESRDTTISCNAMQSSNSVIECDEVVQCNKIKSFYIYWLNMIPQGIMVTIDQSVLPYPFPPEPTLPEAA